MARRYTRDNRGRFSSVGATARGGRLATASGNKRATQTAKLSGGSPKGTVGKPKGLKPGSIKPKAPKPAASASAARRDKLQSGPLAGAGNSVKQGLQGMGNRAINRVETAARLSDLQKAGKLDRLSPSQSRRAQSIFNDAQRKVSAAPRIAAEQRQIQLAIKADKMRRGSVATAPAPAAKPVAGGRPLSRISSIPNTVRQPRVRTQTEGDRAVRSAMRDMPTVPRGRRPDDTWQGINSYNTSFSRPRTMSGRQISGMQDTFKRQGWSARSDSLGRQVTYSKSFDGPGGTSEIARVRVSRRGGPLASGQVEVSRMVSSRPGRRGQGGGIIESRYGLRRNRSTSLKPRRK